MRVVILGAAAGGGFPQWNSNAPGCRRARAGDPAAKPRSQISLAVSADNTNWFVFSASPDLRAQIERFPFLQPKTGLRSTPIQGVVLTDGNVDAVAGLLNLREVEAFSIFATGTVLGVLDENPIFEVLARDIVRRVRVPLDEPLLLPLTKGGASGLTLTLFAVPGKVPLYLERPGAAPPTVEGEETVGAEISDGRHRVFFIPNCARVTDKLLARVEGADALFFDGTLWRDDEMIRAGIGTKTGQRMGHISVGGPDGTLAMFENCSIARRILIHINNSNPILLEDTLEHAAVAAAGWRVGEDGMEVEL
uniref:Coenzyme PQQ synthesis protein B n=1 Tax=Acidicaldus sp. TaxID=1872105 RepID=A0A8J4H8R0_9PROT